MITKIPFLIVKTAILSILISFLCPEPSYGAIQTITYTVKQPFAGSQSADDARIAAVTKAKREVLERAGTYLESLTVVRNSKVDKDEILALTAGVLKTEIVSQKNYHTEDAFGIEVIVKVDVDTTVLEERVKKLLQDKTYLKQLQEAQKRETELLQKLAKLEEENQRLTKQGETTNNLEKRFQEVSRGLTAVQWFYKASALWDDEKFTDPNKAIEYLNHAIDLQKDYAAAYSNRGAAYDQLGQYQRAITDHDDAIRLKPDNALAYNNRGSAYSSMGQTKRAIEDYTTAIGLDPFLVEAYYGRGLNYAVMLGQHQKAIEDFTQAILLKPFTAGFYLSRGISYDFLGESQRAIEDFTQAIRLNPNDADTYSHRGISYGLVGQDQRAIKDFSEAIRLKPNDANSYSHRGITLIFQGDDNHGCSDVKRACELGSCEQLNLVKSNGYCH